MKLEIVPELRLLIERAEAAYQRFYEGVLRETLERTAWGKYVAIHLDTGDHILADSEGRGRGAVPRSLPRCHAIHPADRHPAPDRVMPTIHGRPDDLGFP